jgi:hypothetical protein
MVQPRDTPRRAGAPETGREIKPLKNKGLKQKLAWHGFCYIPIRTLFFHPTSFLYRRIAT